MERFGLLTQGISLRLQPWAELSRPVRPVLPGALSQDRGLAEKFAVLLGRQGDGLPLLLLQGHEEGQRNHDGILFQLALPGTGYLAVEDDRRIEDAVAGDHPAVG